MSESFSSGQFSHPIISFNLAPPLSQIDEKQKLMQQARSNNKVLEHLMRKKISGELPGVFGRLVSNPIQLESVFLCVKLKECC